MQNNRHGSRGSGPLNGAVMEEEADLPGAGGYLVGVASRRPAAGVVVPCAARGIKITGTRR